MNTIDVHVQLHVCACVATRAVNRFTLMYFIKSNHIYINPEKKDLHRDQKHKINFAWPNNELTKHQDSKLFLVHSAQRPPILPLPSCSFHVVNGRL